jgi:hypothetical protein
VIFYDREFILSRVLLFRVPTSQLLAQSLSARALPCLGFSPSSRHPSSAATFRAGSQACATFRHPVFSTARRFSPHSSLQAYFIPQPRPGSRPFRGFSPHTATLPHRKELPPGRWTSPPEIAPVRHRARRLAPTATRFGPRLRGLHPCEAAFTASPLFTDPQAAPLLGFLSSRHSLLTVDHSLPVISAHDVHSPCLRFRADTTRASPACLPQEA